MNNKFNVLIIVSFVFIIVLTALSPRISKFLSSKKINAHAIMQKVLKGLSIADAFTLAVSPFLPAVYSRIISKIFQYTYDAVNIAETLFKSSELPADQRKSTATSIVKTNLKKTGIYTDEEINKFISVSIDLMCRFLPKTNVSNITENNEKNQESERSKIYDKQL